ncbi:MAG: hypothetical protein DRQ43_01255 [Gammaproteobacteria bacterium]|nr:MAG: hypothetical protein DRQ43_01255 [Gammaproteobacteria bacterium]
MANALQGNMVNFKKIISSAVLILACNTVFADIASDFKDPDTAIDKLIENALKQSPDMDYADIIAQLQAAGADADSIESAVASLLDLTPSSCEGPSDLTRNLTPELMTGLLNSSYAALANSGADNDAYNQLTKTVYTMVSVCDAETIAAIDAAVIGNPNVDPGLAGSPAAGNQLSPALTAPLAPSIPDGSGGAGAASSS